MHGLPHGRLLLVPHAREWASRFAAEAARIGEATGNLVDRIEHVGSTAVPGLVAKPVVDVAISVGSAEAADACVVPLRGLGYAYREMHGDDPRRRYHVLDRDGRRLFHLHVWIVPAAGWDGMLAFRDRLRSEPALAASYAAEKLRLAKMHGDDKAAYSEAKEPFIRRALDVPTPADDPASSRELPAEDARAASADHRTPEVTFP